MVAVEIENRSGSEVDEAAAAELARRVLAAEGIDEGELGLTFVPPEESRALKQEHLGIDEATDVLSFPLDGRDELPDGLPRALGGATGARVVGGLLVLSTVGYLLVLALATGWWVLLAIPPAALALTLAFIVCNKVGSPQFHAWVIAPLVLWLLWDRRQARPLVALALVCAALTQLVYPIAYWSLLLIEPVGVLAVTARNCCVVVLFAWAVVRLAGVPVTTATRVDRAPQPQ